MKKNSIDPSKRPIAALIALQVMLVLLIVIATALFLGSVSSGYEDWPELAATRPLVLFSIGAAAVLLSLIIITALNIFYTLIFFGNSRSVLGTLRRLRTLCIIAAVYALAAFIVFWAQSRMMHPTLVATEFLLVSASTLSAVFLTRCIRRFTH